MKKLRVFVFVKCFSARTSGTVRSGFSGSPNCSGFPHRSPNCPGFPHRSPNYSGFPHRSPIHSGCPSYSGRRSNWNYSNQMLSYFHLQIKNTLRIFLILVPLILPCLVANRVSQIVGKLNIYFVIYLESIIYKTKNRWKRNVFFPPTLW